MKVVKCPLTLVNSRKCNHFEHFEGSLSGPTVEFHAVGMSWGWGPQASIRAISMMWDSCVDDITKSAVRQREGRVGELCFLASERNAHNRLFYHARGFHPVRVGTLWSMGAVSRWRWPSKSGPTTRPTAQMQPGTFGFGLNVANPINERFGSTWYMSWVNGCRTGIIKGFSWGGGLAGWALTQSLTHLLNGQAYATWIV